MNVKKINDNSLMNVVCDENHYGVLDYMDNDTDLD